MFLSITLPPPQDGARKVRTRVIYATPDEVREIKQALEDLAATGHRLAAIYADMAAAAEEYVAAQPADLWPPDEERHFIG